ncbi:MAG TPA: alpha-amylase family glycosyl hydrolase [Candidatus Dormibacteraeota bacterium]|nr:alpha-amylase family glycosyl hydrolase [Candidatus Dormibacteraeota bacterium]
MKEFVPTGDGSFLAYVFGDGLEYVRGTNAVRSRASAGDDPPPLAGATRAVVVDRIPDLEDRDAVEDLYARSVLVLALHQELSGAFIAEPGDDVLIAHALDACGERGASEAFYEWALWHRPLDGVLMWGLEKHLRVAYGSPLHERHARLRDGPGPELAATPPALPTLDRALIQAAVRRRNSAGVLTNVEGVDLRGHALFLLAVHANLPRIRGGEDFFFGHQALAQEGRRKRALYGGAFHGGLVAADGDPLREVEVRQDLQPATVSLQPTEAGRYKVRVESRGRAVWASDSDPRPGGQEFVRSTAEGPPDWVHDAVVYQVMVDRFARADGPLPKPGSSTALYGGTLDGVRENLDHIESLGCNALWLSAIHQSPSHHGYDVEDHFTVEPRYGGDAALKRLIASAHQRGMRVLLDFVPNHTGRGHHLFREAIARGGEAAEFYRFWQWPHYYRRFGDGVSLPELDTGNRRVREYLVGAARHWIREYGADGLRCDHVAGVDPVFWVELRRAVREEKPDALVLGEATGHFEWLARYAGRIDAIFDFDFAHMVRQTFARGRTSLPDFARWMDQHEGAFPGLALATLLDNHDMNRILWMSGGDTRRLKLAATLLLTMPGAPVVYYGTEVGVTQRHDAVIENAEARLPMLWGDDQDRGLLEHFQRLGRLRAALPALRRGSRRTLRATDDELVYERMLGGERLVVTLNVRELDGSVVDDAGRDRLGEDDVLGVGPDQRPR